MKKRLKVYIIYKKKKRQLVSYQTEIVVRNLGYSVDVIYDVNDSGVVQTQSMWKYILQAHLFRKDRQSCGFSLGKAGFLF